MPSVKTKNPSLHKAPVKGNDFIVKNPYLILSVLFLLVLGIRLYFAFQTTTFESDEAYFNLRQVNSVVTTHGPMFDDPLSFGGRKLIFLPTFEYFLALFGMILPIAFVAKILPNIFACSLIFVVYLITKELTKDVKAALFAAFASAFIPAFFSSTINSVSIYSFVIPLFFLTIYFFMKAESNEEYAYFCLFSFCLMILTNSIALMLVLGILLYLLLVRLEKLKWSWVEFEISIFSLFLITWFYFIIYKKALLMNSYSIIWENTPAYVLDHTFSQITVMESLYLVGIIPFVFGIYLLYKNMFGEKRKQIILLTAITLLLAIMLWFRMIKPLVGIYILGVILVILFGCYCKQLFDFIENTKAPGFNRMIYLLLIAGLLLTSAVPAIIFAREHINNSLNEKENKALIWLKENTPKGAVVLAGISEGQYIASVAERKNVADSNFLMIKDANQVSEDIHNIYSSEYETSAIPLITKYNVSYIYLSSRTKAEQKIDVIRYTSDTNCFKLVYDDTVKIYRPLCQITEFS